MKKSYRHLGTALVAGAFIAAAPLGLSQIAVTQTTTTQSSGIVSEFSPNTVVLKTESSTEPMRYTYSKTTTVVDDAGNPVDISVVKTGVPVQVIYAKDGDGMVAQKIIVQKRVTSGGGSMSGAVVEKHESTTTTTTTDSK